MDYYDSAEDIIITQDRALQELARFSVLIAETKTQKQKNITNNKVIQFWFRCATLRPFL